MCHNPEPAIVTWLSLDHATDKELVVMMNEAYSYNDQYV